MIQVLAFLISSVGWAESVGEISASRKPHQSYLEFLSPQISFKRPEWNQSVEGVATKYSEEGFYRMAHEEAFTSHSYLILQDSYKWIRDLRFLYSQRRPEFQRRITWLYPDDGCFARADLAIRQLNKKGFSGLKKIFAFGNLEADTPNSKDGVVYWWFHVAPIVKVNLDYYVIDPAIDPSRLLTVKEWLQRMNRDFDTVRLAVCDEGSYDPGSHCDGTDPFPKEEVLTHQSKYLDREWYRMVELGRNPELILGDYPPWGPVLADEKN